MDRATGLVLGQAAALAGIVLPVRPRWRLVPVVRAGATLAVAVGGALAFAGALPHGRRLTAFVDPPHDAALLTGGVYRWSRHPIYVGLLLGAGGVAVRRRHPAPALAWLGLGAVLAMKTRLEEQALAERFGRRYLRYAARTPRLFGVPARGRRLIAIVALPIVRTTGSAGLPITP